MRVASFVLAAVTAVSVGCARDRGGSGQVEGSSLSARSTTTEIARFVRASFSELLPSTPLRRSDGRFYPTLATSFRRTGRLEASLGSTASQPVRLAVPGGDVSVEILSTDVRDVVGELDREALVFANALPATHVVQSVDGARFEELRVLTAPGAPTTARYRLHASEGVSAVRVREGRIELLDRSGRPRLVAAPMIAIDAKGARRTLSVQLEGSAADSTVTASLDASGLSYPITIDPSWTRVANWSRPADSEPQTGGLAVTTGDRVLVVGGDASTGTERVDLYDPSTDTWSLVGSLAVARHGHMVASIAGGKALAIGGQDAFANVLSSVEIFDPATSTWTATGGLITARSGGSATTLTDGRVLIAGGTTTSGAANTTGETYDPTSGKWTAAATMPVSGGSAFSLSYLFAAPSARGIGLATDPTSGAWTTIIYNPVTNAWAVGKAIADFSLYGAQAYGAKLAAVGYRSSLGDYVSAIYDSGTNSWSALTALPTDVPYSSTSIVKLSTGNLVSAGYTAGSYGGAIFDATTQTWSAAGSTTLGNTLGGIALSGGRAFFSDYNGGVLFGTFSDGAACSTADQCSSGFCIDGVCCKTACTAQCQSCNEPSKVGTCVTIAGKPRGTRTPCGGSDCPGSCDGAGTACVAAPATLACGVVSCAGSTFTGLGHCSGTDTSCVSADAKPCAGNFACASGAVCGTTCSGDSECAAGFHCTGGACVAAADAGVDTGVDASTDDAADAAPDTPPDTTIEPDSTPVVDSGVPNADAPAVEPTSSYTLCTSAGDCQSGFCVEGVCCDTACGEACHSCALPSAPGRCTLVPSGNDPRLDCSGGNACSMTCGGNGKCVTAFAGSQCTPSKCTGPTQGVGAAYCPGAGAKCPNDAVIAFDCAPYACAPAFGACLTTCARSDQCAPGYACDPTSRSCLPAVPETPPADSGGCAYGGASGGLMFGWSMIALAIGWARRRASVARGEGGRHA